MGTFKSMSNVVGQLHELLMKLEEFGWNTELSQKVIINKQLARDICLLASGGYKVVSVPPLEPTGTLIIPSTTLKKKEVFIHRGGGSNVQHHWDNFKNIVLAHAGDVLVSSGMKLHEYTLTKNLSDLEICNELGGESAVCVRSYDEVLITLYHIMQDEKYRDGKANIVYFMHNNVLLYAYCFWRGSEWYCFAGRAGSGVWDAGNRVFSFATPEPQN